MDVGANIKNMAFPWYDDITRQNYQKRWCNGDVTSFRLITPYYKLPPFQLRRSPLGITNEITGWEIENISTGEIVDLFPLMQAGALDYQTTGDIEYIIYEGMAFTSLFTTSGGLWFSTITDGTNTWYSDVFFIVCFADPNDVTGGIVGISDTEGLLVESPDDFLLAAWDDFVLP